MASNGNGQITAIAQVDGEVRSSLPAEVMEKVVALGDLSKLTPAERLLYYNRVCESLGLNPLTRPFEYIQLNGKLTLYARRDATDQLRRLRGISVQIVSREKLDDIYVVLARATDRDGRTDEAIGAVSISGLKGEALANALMKAETKAKRRVTLSLAGLGWLDETEAETVADPQPEMRNVTPAQKSSQPTTADESTPPATTVKAANRQPSTAQLLEDAKAIYHKARTQGMSDDDIRAALQEATGRNTLRGWRPTAEELAAWRKALQARQAAQEAPAGSQSALEQAVNAWGVALADADLTAAAGNEFLLRLYAAEGGQADSVLQLPPAWIMQQVEWLRQHGGDALLDRLEAMRAEEEMAEADEAESQATLF